MVHSIVLVALAALPGFELPPPDAGVVEAPPAVVGPTPEPAPVAQPAPAPVAAPAAATAVTAPPAKLDAQQVLDAVFTFVRPYGTLKPTVIVSGSAVESFSQPNASAITAAGNPVLANVPGEPRLTFQVAQSRAGLWFLEKGPVRARLELDFIDFTKASPTVASLPRLRLVYVEWAPSDAFTLLAGQDWDLHAPVAPHGGNMVGGRFLSGNAGFMRQQVKAFGKLGAFELAGAVGMEGVNATAKDNALELSVVPTAALRASWLVAKGRVGVSVLGTSLRFGAGSATERRALAGGASAFADVTFGDTNLRAEFNLGRNLANLGSLTLGFGNAGADVDEWGGFVSVRHGLTPRHFVFVNGGLMRVLTPRAVKPSYAYASLPADGSLPAMGSAALAGTGPGILHNAGFNAGYELKVAKNLSFILEGFYLHTEHALLEMDAARISGYRDAFGGELCAFLTF